MLGMSIRPSCLSSGRVGEDGGETSGVGGGPGGRYLDMSSSLSSSTSLLPPSTAMASASSSLSSSSSSSSLSAAAASMSLSLTPLSRPSSVSALLSNAAAIAAEPGGNVDGGGRGGAGGGGGGGKGTHDPNDDDRVDAPGATNDDDGGGAATDKEAAIVSAASSAAAVTATVCVRIISPPFSTSHTATATTASSRTLTRTTQPLSDAVDSLVDSLSTPSSAKPTADKAGNSVPCMHRNTASISRTSSVPEFAQSSSSSSSIMSSSSSSSCQSTVSMSRSLVSSRTFPPPPPPPPPPSPMKGKGAENISSNISNGVRRKLKVSLTALKRKVFLTSSSSASSLLSLSSSRLDCGASAGAGGMMGGEARRRLGPYALDARRTVVRAGITSRSLSSMPMVASASAITASTVTETANRSLSPKHVGPTLPKDRLIIGPASFKSPPERINASSSSADECNNKDCNGIERSLSDYERDNDKKCKDGNMDLAWEWNVQTGTIRERELLPPRSLSLLSSLSSPSSSSSSSSSSLPPTSLSLSNMMFDAVFDPPSITNNALPYSDNDPCRQHLRPVTYISPDQFEHSVCPVVTAVLDGTEGLVMLFGAHDLSSCCTTTNTTTTTSSTAVATAGNDANALSSSLIGTLSDPRRDGDDFDSNKNSIGADGTVPTDNDKNDPGLIGLIFRQCQRRAVSDHGRRRYRFWMRLLDCDGKDVGDGAKEVTDMSEFDVQKTMLDVAKESAALTSVTRRSEEEGVDAETMGRTLSFRLDVKSRSSVRGNRDKRTSSLLVIDLRHDGGGVCDVDNGGSVCKKSASNPVAEAIEEALSGLAKWRDNAAASSVSNDDGEKDEKEDEGENKNIDDDGDDDDDYSVGLQTLGGSSVVTFATLAPFPFFHPKGGRGDKESEKAEGGGEFCGLASHPMYSKSKMMMLLQPRLFGNVCKEKTSGGHCDGMASSSPCRVCAIGSLSPLRRDLQAGRTTLRFAAKLRAALGAGNASPEKSESLLTLTSPDPVMVACTTHIVTSGNSTVVASSGVDEVRRCDINDSIIAASFGPASKSDGDMIDATSKAVTDFKEDNLLSVNHSRRRKCEPRVNAGEEKEKKKYNRNRILMYEVEIASLRRLIAAAEVVNIEEHIRRAEEEVRSRLEENQRLKREIEVVRSLARGRRGSNVSAAVYSSSFVSESTEGESGSRPRVPGLAAPDEDDDDEEEEEERRKLRGAAQFVDLAIRRIVEASVGGGKGERAGCDNDKPFEPPTTLSIPSVNQEDKDQEGRDEAAPSSSICSLELDPDIFSAVDMSVNSTVMDDESSWAPAGATSELFDASSVISGSVAAGSVATFGSWRAAGTIGNLFSRQGGGDGDDDPSVATSHSFVSAVGSISSKGLTGAMREGTRDSIGGICIQSGDDVSDDGLSRGSMEASECSWTPAGASGKLLDSCSVGSRTQTSSTANTTIGSIATRGSLRASGDKGEFLKALGERLASGTNSDLTSEYRAMQAAVLDRRHSQVRVEKSEALRGAMMESNPQDDDDMTDSSWEPAGATGDLFDSDELSMASGMSFQSALSGMTDPSGMFLQSATSRKKVASSSPSQLVWDLYRAQGLLRSVLDER